MEVGQVIQIAGPPTPSPRFRGDIQGSCKDSRGYQALVSRLGVCIGIFTATLWCQWKLVMGEKT